MSRNEDEPSGVLEELLLAYDRALADGSAAQPAELGSPAGDEAALRERRRHERCLQQLEMLWPRRLPRGASRQWHAAAVALADQLRHMPPEELPLLRSLTTPALLEQALVESDLVSLNELEQVRQDLGSAARDGTVEELTCVLFQRGILTLPQFLILVRGELRKLRIADYVILEEIGRGGMGAVYRAWDPTRNLQVALKTLPKANATTIHRFKQEFRRLVDLLHPNLVVLDELHCVDGQWFFTMELITGRHLTDYVRGTPSAADGTRSWPPEPASADDLAPATHALHCPLSTADQFERLRHTLRQLAEGLHYLHGAGKLHRDIKPSNVLVTDEGRVVLVDFGLSSDLPVPGAQAAVERAVVGTAAYMSPEQSAGVTLDEASDWYSVGVMLYEILAGRRPFEGTAQQLQEQKQRGPAPLLEVTVPDAHRDLLELCGELLRPQPDARPRGTDIVRRLACAGAGQIAEPQPADPVFVGRHAELEQLDAMFHALADRGVSCALVHGPPGIGKTALVDFFLRRFDGRPEVVVLRGRCHERESLPYRAVDNIIDELTERLLTDPTASPGACAAGDWGPLVQMFPTLGRVPWLSRPAVPRATASQSQEMRQSAVESLRALLRHLADGQRVVIVVDDLQWLDTDGAALLGDLIAPPDPPCLLLVACYRDTTPFSGPLRGLLTRVSQLMASADCREIAVGALKPHETQELAQRLLSRTTSGCLMVSDVVRESRGDPFLLGELVRHVEHSQGWMRSHVDLEAMIAERVERLSGPAQQLLTLLAVAGHPLEVADACRASGVRPEPRILGSLSAEHLVRSSGEGVARTLEPYHDRLREVLVARLSTVEHTACHRQIAETLADAPDPDPQTLFMHFDAAGDAAAACAHVLHAAERAVSNLAFDTAARLYRRAFELNAVMPDQQPATHRRLAEALANAGRSVEAAAEFQVAAGESAGLVALDLRRHAAELLLRAGRLEEGCRVLTDVLAAVGLRMPRTAGDAKRMVLRNLLWLRLHGTRYRERQECDIAPEELARLDVCWSATILVTSDTVRGTPFIMQFPRLALQTGEPCRVSLALAQLAMLKSFAGNWAGALESFGRAEALALRAGSPQARGYVRMCVGFAHAMRGAWRASLRYSDEADAMLREQTDAVRLERSAGQPAILAALFFLGELDELARRVPQMIEDARRSEDAISAAAPYTYFGNVVWLAADDVEPARRYAAEVLARFPTTPYLQQHLFELIGSAHIDLYEGDGRGAARRLNDAWPGYRRSLHSRTPFYRAYMHHLRARAALAAIQTGADPAGLTRLASQEARTLERERMPWCDALASFLRAGLAAATGQSHEACACLQSAITQAESADMPLFATAGRRCLGQLLGAAAGRVLIREADAWMTNRGIRVPQRFAAMLVPGFCRRGPV